MSKVRKRERDEQVCDLTFDDGDELEPQKGVANSAAPRINTRRSLKIKNPQESILVAISDEKIAFTPSDIETLNEGSFLNDVVVDFYCCWLGKQLPQDTMSRIHIFSSYLYTKLLLEPTSCDMQGVAKWTKDVDIFEKDFLFFPVCERLHWYVPQHVVPHTQITLYAFCVLTRRAQDTRRSLLSRRRQYGSSTRCQICGACEAGQGHNPMHLTLQLTAQAKAAHSPSDQEIPPGRVGPPQGGRTRPARLLRTHGRDSAMPAAEELVRLRGLRP
jgi:hypothetical protein